jgi:hypothetical protein
MISPLSIKTRTTSLAAEIGKLAQNSANLPTTVTYPALGFLNHLCNLLIDGQNDGILGEDNPEAVELLVSGYYAGYRENTPGILDQTHQLIVKTLEQSGWLPL